VIGREIATFLTLRLPD